MMKQLRLLGNLLKPNRKTPDPKYAIPEADKNLAGKVIVFTGGTNGIGLEAVEMLYKMGADIVLLGRNEKAGQAIADTLNKTAGGKVEFELCDLSSMDSVKACADRILLKHPVIDVLVNCAGVNLPKRVITKDGFEGNWATNYFAPYLLTTILLPAIKKAPNSRIVNLTTDTEYIDELPLDNIHNPEDFETPKAYYESKLALNMFTTDLAQELEGTGSTANYLLPGFIKSNLLSTFEGPAKAMLQGMMNLMASPTVVGSDRVVRLAISSQYKDKNGTYTAEDKILAAHPEVGDLKKRKRLHDLTQKFLAKWLPQS